MNERLEQNPEKKEELEKAGKTEIEMKPEKTGKN